MNTNLNFAWAQTFVKRLEKLGVRDVCVSPGSRNTPLTLAFGESKKIKSHVFVDERSSAFFALGLAKKSGKPVAIVTTSGTAVAELYPAIIEAYQTCAPLLICTADRPEYLLNTGANQTINQRNIYANHINAFFDLRLPKLTKARLFHLVKVTDKAFGTALSKGPVHLNFPFEKPLEPESLNADADEKTVAEILSLPPFIEKQKERNIPKRVIKKITSSSKILILLGGNLSAKKENAVLRLSQKLNAPVIADAISSARFSGKNKNVISYGAAIVKSQLKVIEPDLILSFGKAPTSNSVLDFYERSTAFKILINAKNRVHDPSRTYDILINADEIEFADEVGKLVVKSDKKFLDVFLKAEKAIEQFTNDFIQKNSFVFEGNVARSLINALPEKSNLFIGNSTMPRDIDFFSGKPKKNIAVYSNRGASGIDGIISTSAGVAFNNKKKSFLYIGDLSFFYDISFLYYLAEKNIPLTVILQNNNGGGIFRMLPIANRKNDFDKFFRTSVNADFEKISAAFGIPFFTAKNGTELAELINKNLLAPKIIELKTDSNLSAKIRKTYFEETAKLLASEF